MKTRRAYNIVPYSTSRESRLNEALSPYSVAVYDKSAREHLTFISEYAKDINYYNLNNKKAGNWYAFFSDNDVVFLSLLLQTDVHALHKKKKELYDKCTQPLYKDLAEAYAREFQLFFIVLVELLGSWFLQAKKIQQEAVLYELKNAVKNRFLQEIELVITQDEKVINTPEVQGKLYKIYAAWQNNINGESSLIAREDFKITNDPDKLVNACNTFLNSIIYILQRVPEWLEQALQEKENHTMHIGLLLSFLKLHDHVKDQFNDLSKKHLDYYYRDLLQQKERSKNPDRCAVFFELAKEASYCMLKKGTRLSAGQTETGQEIIYSTCEEEELSRSRLAEIRTLFVSTNPIIAPLNKTKLITGIYTFQKNITEKELLNEDPYEFHLFGTDSFGNLNVSQKDIKQPDIGWAIAAPVFYMKEGKRSVSLSIRFDEESMIKLWNNIKIMTINSGYSEIEMLYRFFSATFDLKITGAKEWITIEDYAVDFKESKHLEYPEEIVFLFSFGKETPEIAGFNAEIHQLQYDTHFPVLQMALQSNNTYYPYGLLKDMIVEEIVININCEAIKDIELYNVNGKLESNKPFEPLGPNPLKGDCFYIGYEELAKKKLKALSLNINWYKLPEEGFKSYYEGYPGDIDNDSFTFSISALSQGEWTPKKEYRQNIGMFQQENNILLENSTYDIDTEKTWYIPEFAKTELPFSFENAVNGFFKLELDNPSIGFGYEAYLKIMNNTVYENLNARNSRKRKPFTTPETPFVPKIRSMRMQYSASQTINFNTSEEGRKADLPFDFFHLHPFGILKTANLKYIKETGLVPKFNSRGYLYLGLKDIVPNQSLSLYFRIITKTNTSKDVTIGDIKWEFLSGNSWSPIQKEKIIEDDTVGVTNSGIIKIIIPGHISQNHPLFSNTMFWLRISAPNSLDIIRICSYINTQAVLVEKDLSTVTDTASGDPLPEQTISAVYDKNKDIKSVFQPFPSYGGYAAEETKDFYNRVSERLYHKNRAITTGDYERLILQEFPEIFQVSCLTPTLFPNEIKTNEVVLMILRNMHVNDDSSHRKFNVTTLERVKEYVAKLCPPSIKITVINPVYEVIRVSCHVKLKDYRLSGEKLKKLKQAIDVHIAPWLYHRDRKTEYRKHILHAKGIENLIAKQPYVDVVTNFSLVQFNRQSNSSYTYRDTAVGTVISPSRPWSVFVPAPSHNISLISEHATDPPTPLKIGVMQIEDDFILQPEELPADAHETIAEEQGDNRPRTVLKVRF